MTAISPIEPVLLQETERWLVIQKPAGWLTIAGRWEDTSPVLRGWVEENYGATFVVHRLDRETSGVILFARSAEDHRLANLWFMKRQIKKVYHCLCTHRAPAPILKIRVEVEGVPSRTQVEVMENYEEGFLARVNPLTGRRHQIRIHLSHEGYPLWGDSRYGGPVEVKLGEKDLCIRRVALHATSLELPDGEKFEAPWPEDFKSWVEALREGGKRV